MQSRNGDADVENGLVATGKEGEGWLDQEHSIGIYTHAVPLLSHVQPFATGQQRNTSCSAAHPEEYQRQCTHICSGYRL